MWSRFCAAALLSAVWVMAAENPLARDAAAFDAGRVLYLERCAVCHGQDARGSMAVDLIRSRVVAAGPAQKLFNLIRKGIPGTEMFAHPIGDDATWRIVTYLHGVARPGDRPPLPGDPRRGGELFDSAGCRRCHVVQGAGGFLGRDLSSIALERTADAIREAVLAPGAAVERGYRLVDVQMRSGRRVRGLLKNEDTFSMQILTAEGEYVSLARAEIGSVQRLAESLMPAAEMPAEDLRDLLAFLDRRRRPFVPDASGFNTY